MTTTENLAPLLDLPPAQVELRDGVLSHLCRPGRHRRPRRRRGRPAPWREQGCRLRRRAGGMECSRLARSHPTARRSPGFRFDGALTVTYEGADPVDAGIRVALELQATGEPRWLVPGVFYGENRPEGCTRIYPRFTPGRVDVARMESDSWSFRADRCATPAVFGPGGGLLTGEESPLGQAGVGFAQRGLRGGRSGSTSRFARSRSVTTARRPRRRPTCARTAGSRASRSSSRSRCSTTTTTRACSENFVLIQHKQRAKARRGSRSSRPPSSPPGVSGAGTTAPSRHGCSRRLRSTATGSARPATATPCTSPG